jgi:co-chaperonin GroES (HSP10)
MKFVPLFDNVLVKRDKKQEKKSPGGVVIPKSADKATESVATVVEIGKDAREKIPAIREGSVVCVSQYAGVDIKVGDDDKDGHTVIRVEEILGVFED